MHNRKCSHGLAVTLLAIHVRRNTEKRKYDEQGVLTTVKHVSHKSLDSRRKLWFPLFQKFPYYFCGPEYDEQKGTASAQPVVYSVSVLSSCLATSLITHPRSPPDFLPAAYIMSAGIASVT
jgi:hypothetical protein